MAHTTRSGNLKGVRLTPVSNFWNPYNCTKFDLQIMSMLCIADHTRYTH